MTQNYIIYDDKPTKNRWNFVLQILTAFTAVQRKFLGHDLK